MQQGSVAGEGGGGGVKGGKGGKGAGGGGAGGAGGGSGGGGLKNSHRHTYLAVSSSDATGVCKWCEMSHTDGQQMSDARRSTDASSTWRHSSTYAKQASPAACSESVSVHLIWQSVTMRFEQSMQSVPLGQTE